MILSFLNFSIKPCLFLCKPFWHPYLRLLRTRHLRWRIEFLLFIRTQSTLFLQVEQSPSSVTDRRSSTDMLLDEVKALRKEVADLRRSRSQFRHNNVRRKRSNSRSSKLCWYHFRFQANAKKCIPPCSFTENPTLGE
ncbi:hypothetical protein TNCV_918301 [Trichonephila clavipes]|nr:hypothetical protein TNCV_918301 [Trichonephila clavipes]